MGVNCRFLVTKIVLSGVVGYVAFSIWSYLSLYGAMMQGQLLPQVPVLRPPPHHPYQYRELMMPAQTCPPKRLFLAIVVHSAPSNFRKRQLIRETWGNFTHLRRVNAKLVFVMGRTRQGRVMQRVRREGHLHGDIMQKDFVDSYRNLSIKALLGLGWAVSQCRARYILKSDDDMLVDILQLTDELATNMADDRGDNLMFCSVIKNALVDRDNDSKWFTTGQEYRGRFYPSYCQGSAWVMEWNLGRQVYLAALRERLLWIDDVWLTGILTRQLNVTLTSNSAAYVEDQSYAGDLLQEVPHRPLWVFFNIHDMEVFRKVWQAVEKRHNGEQPLLKK